MLKRCLMVCASYVQALFANAKGLSLEGLLEVCNQQVESDSMVLALKAIAAMEMMVCDEGQCWALMARLDLNSDYE